MSAWSLVVVVNANAIGQCRHQSKYRDNADTRATGGSADTRVVLLFAGHLEALVHTWPV